MARQAVILPFSRGGDFTGSIDTPPLRRQGYTKTLPSHHKPASRAEFFSKIIGNDELGG